MADEPIIATPEGGLTTPELPPMGVQDKERDRQMGNVLTEAIQQGKDSVPAIVPPLVCKPQEIESWRVFKIMSEFVDGFEILKRYGLSATFFGSARETFAPEIYAAATELSGKLAKAGFAILSGGSAGIMQAANRGAFDAGGASVGLNIRLEDNQGMNKFLTDSMTFDHFFVRKVMLAFASEVYVYFPGGYGTLDEFTEILTLVQTKKIRKIPIVLYGREYWTPIVDLFCNTLYKKYHAIDEADLDLFHV
ncbi:MAG: TIGR00730 family Rossman fold protein, partial [Patescibacteria group bacterium]